ncbi:MAG TPA: phosphonate ABC transporter ATP-binding protein, partial [Flavobacterium sp.]|nr:phosphonate ABC transporter ATP-binding protein [Flavobacterium sp.]
GIVFQDFKLLADRSIYENLLFVLKATGWNEKAEMDLKIEEVLDKVGMKTQAHKMPHQISGGE